MIKLKGKVNKGKKRGKALGFPTANIKIKKSLPEGIYLSFTQVNGIKYPGLTFIGKAITFSEDYYQAESYILDFNKSLYGKWIKIVLIKKIRDNQKFKDEKELIRAMKEDEQKARKYFKLN